MFLGNPVEPLFDIGTPVEADLMAGKRQMPICRIRPGDLPALHGFLVAGPEPVDDLALRSVRGDDPQRLAVGAKHRHFLRPETLFRQRSKRGHHVDVWIALPVMINPVGDHALGRQVVPDELAHKGDVL